MLIKRGFNMEHRFKRAERLVNDLIDAGYNEFPFPDLEMQQLTSILLQDDTHNKYHFIIEPDDTIINIIADSLNNNSNFSDYDMISVIKNQAVMHYYDDIAYLYKHVIEEREAYAEELCRERNHPYCSHEEWEVGIIR